MSDEKPPAVPPAMPEQSIQEIIASISRIMEEDSRMAHPPPPVRDKADILELTEAIEPDGSVRRVAGQRSFGSQAAAEPPPASSPVSSTGQTEPDPAADASVRVTADQRRANLVSATAAESAIAAFSQLESVAGAQHAERGPAVGAGGRTLEEIVQDALRPLLQAWLDHHLPEIVERLVQQEIERLVREARLR
jgi:cell pole-organizing protein PopZ